MRPSSGSGPTQPSITEPLVTVRDALTAATPRPVSTDDRELKKNYAERLSRALAVLIANKLRPHFPGITPDEQGRRHESPVPTAKGYKRLDVNYSTPQLGLGLGVSIKTLNFPDLRTGRYTKNFTRIDNELRAEASDYHVRQPFALLVGVIFLPFASCDDSRRAHSSFAQAVRIFRSRNRRFAHTDSAELFESIHVALYDEHNGKTCLFDVMQEPPFSGRPQPDDCLSVEEWVDSVKHTFEERNPPRR